MICSAYVIGGTYTVKKKYLFVAYKREILLNNESLTFV